MKAMMSQLNEPFSSYARERKPLDFQGVSRRILSVVDAIPAPVCDIRVNTMYLRFFAKKKLTVRNEFAKLKAHTESVSGNN